MSLISVPTVRAIVYVIDGAAALLTAGIKGDLSIPFNCRIIGMTMLADQTGTVAVDIWKDVYSAYPPTVADTITSATPPTITTGLQTTNSALTNWITLITAGDILRFNVNASPAPLAITRVVIILTVST